MVYTKGDLIEINIAGNFLKKDFTVILQHNLTKQTYTFRVPNTSDCFKQKLSFEIDSCSPLGEYTYYIIQDYIHLLDLDCIKNSTIWYAAFLTGKKNQMILNKGIPVVAKAAYDKIRILHSGLITRIKGNFPCDSHRPHPVKHSGCNCK